jgi:hypothetical protein
LAAFGATDITSDMFSNLRLTLLSGDAAPISSKQAVRPAPPFSINNFLFVMVMSWD